MVSEEPVLELLKLFKDFGLEVRKSSFNVFTSGSLVIHGGFKSCVKGNLSCLSFINDASNEGIKSIAEIDGGGVEFSGGGEDDHVFGCLSLTDNSISEVNELSHDIIVEDRNLV